MRFIELYTFNEYEQLLPYINALKQAGVIHRLYEKAGQQILLVNEQQVDMAKQLHQQFLAGHMAEPATSQPNQKNTPSLIQAALAVPLTSLLIILSLLGFLVDYFQWSALVSALLFQPTSFGVNTLVFSSAIDAFLDGQFWRLITPIFLHFGPLHLVFNCLWCWELGKKIEHNESTADLLLLVLILAVFSNIVQYHFSGAGIFGGMSGVVYGLMAYCGVTQWLIPNTKLAMPPAIYGIMLVFLVLGFTNVFSIVGVGKIANAAHIGGLLAGAFWALFVRKNTF